MSDSPAPTVRLRPEILSLPAYKQGTSTPGAFKLSSNENPYPPLAGVLEKALEAGSHFNRYPNAAAPELVAALADRWGVDSECVIVGAGSVSLLVQFVQAAAAQGDEVIFSWRSFEAYPWMLALTGATAVAVPNRADHGHDLPAMAAAITDRTRLIVVCSPNNPTGTIVTKHEFSWFMQQVPSDVLVILDEAYAEFVTDEDAVSGPEVLGEYPNLVVLRTFSKAYGLAGLRVGYGIGPAAIIGAARVTGIPLGITDMAQAAALESLASNEELLERVSTICARRDAVWDALVHQGWMSPQPHANFVWLPTGTQSREFAEVYAENGIIVRAYGDDGIRITIGEQESVEKLLSISNELVGKLKKVHSSNAIA